MRIRFVLLTFCVIIQIRNVLSEQMKVCFPFSKYIYLCNFYISKKKLKFMIFRYILKLFSIVFFNFLEYKEHLPFNIMLGYNNLCDSCLPINRHSILLLATPLFPLSLLPSKCKFFFFGIKVSVVMTLNKIGSDFKKLNFYWLFAKSEITFFPLSLSLCFSLCLSCLLACFTFCTCNILF